MVYIIEALSHNHLLKPGDQIAIATPIFTPYLQIPSVKDYGLVSIDVSTTAEENWDIPEAELAKLEDPSVKSFFLVNLSNPASHALSENTPARLAQVVEKNPDMIILTDDVYGTFAKDFQSVYAVLPYNTILVYSFSKHYGITGWRIGLIAMNEQCSATDCSVSCRRQIRPVCATSTPSSQPIPTACPSWTGWWRTAAP